MADKIKVALLGAGNVGSQAARILIEDNAVLEKRIGAPVELIGIAVRDTRATRHWNADPSLYTTDAEALIDAADVVLELTGGTFADALADAQKLGYAEADPTADVEGLDAASKAAIVASLAFHSDFTIDDVHTEGITAITADDVAAADADGYVIKLLAICEREGENGVNIRVNPTLIPRQHPLAGVHGAFNAVFVEAENAGELMFYGPGAGGAPTASAVLGDFVSLARRLVLGGPGVPETSHAQLHATSLDNVISRYSVGVLVEDRLGVLANITRILAEHGISVDSLRQSAPKEGVAQIRMVTHSAKDSDLRRAIAVIDALDTVREVNSVIRVESEKH